MKRIPIVLTILTSCCLAQQEPFGDGRGPGNHAERDPSGNHGPPEDPGPRIPPPNIRAFLQYIEIPHTDLSNVLADAPSGAVSRAHAMALVEKRAARIVDSCFFAFQSGSRASAESIREFIYPTEKDSGGLGTPVPPPSPSSFPVTPSLRNLAVPSWIQWDTRNAGLTFEFDSPAALSRDNPVVSLIILGEDVSCPGMIPWTDKRDRWGDDSIRMPLFETRRVIQTLNLNPGAWEFAAILDPLPRPPAPAPATKVLLFVRCEVL